MKKIVALSAFVLMMFVMASVAFGYTYDSRMDPKVFLEWELMDWAYEAGPSQVLALYKNPKNEIPKYVLCRLAPPLNNLTIMYSYLDENEEVSMFILEQDEAGNGHYKLFNKYSEDYKDSRFWKAHWRKSDTGEIMSWEEADKYVKRFLVDAVKDIEEAKDGKKEL